MHNLEVDKDKPIKDNEKRKYKYYVFKVDGMNILEIWLWAKMN